MLYYNLHQEEIQPNIYYNLLSFLSKIPLNPKILNLQSNIYQVSLGKRVLRSDTAAIAAIFGLQQIIDN